MAARFEGLTGLVTGAGRGIGRAVAAVLAAEGAHVVVCDIDADAAARAAEEIRRLGGAATGLQADVTSRTDMTAAVRVAVEQRSSLDLLVSNVGVAREAPFESVTEADWDFQVRANLTGTFLTCQAAMPSLLASAAGGRAVLVGSVNGLSAFGHEAYSAAKAGLVSLTQNLAVRYGRQGVRVNLVAPGTILTEVWDDRFVADPGLRDRLQKQYPSSSLGTPADVAYAVAFLLSAEARWINGVVLPVDGGLTAGSVAMVLDRAVQPPSEAGR